MAEALGLASSVIAIINLSAKVATLCRGYSTAVGNAKADITRLQSQLSGLHETLEGVRCLFDSPNGQALVTSRKLLDSLDGCTSELDKLRERLDPGKAGKVMCRFGLRAFKWPFDNKEVANIISNLESYERTIALGLQVDQINLLLDIRQRIGSVLPQPSRDDISTACKPCFSVSFKGDPDSVDRPDIIAWMKEQFTGPTSRMALVGMGGFGKSQAAIRFAHQIHETLPQTSVFWVHASSRLRFEVAYRSIADRLRLPRRKDPGDDMLGLVRHWLQREEVGPWLMVLDNVNDVNLFHISLGVRRDKISHSPADLNPIAVGRQRPLASFLPKCRNGIILATSRSLTVAEKLTGSHNAVRKISTIDDAQVLQLFRNKLEGSFDVNTANILSNPTKRLSRKIFCKFTTKRGISSKSGQGSACVNLLNIDSKRVGLPGLKGLHIALI